MKLFLDTANLEEIRQAADTGFLAGVTTNPTWIAKEGRSEAQQLLDICGLVDGPVSAQVIGETTLDMVRDGQQLAKLHPNIVVKCPVTLEGLRAMGVLAAQKIKVNATLCFNPMQALLAAEAGAHFVSVLIGRIDDTRAQRGVPTLKRIVDLYAAGYATRIIAASLRTVEKVLESAEAGAYAATMKLPVFMELFREPRTDETLANMLAAYRGAFELSA